MRVVEIVEAYVQERELPRLARDLVGLGRVKLPPDFLVLVEDELRLQPAEDLADVLLQAQRDGEVHVIVPRDQAVVAPGPDECARVHEEGMPALVRALENASTVASIMSFSPPTSCTSKPLGGSLAGTMLLLRL